MGTQRKSGKEELLKRLQAALRMSTRKEAELLIRVFESSLEDILVEHLDEDGYAVKLGAFGRFVVRHRPSFRRKIGFSGEVREIPPKRKLRFTALGRLRKLERGR